MNLSPKQSSRETQHLPAPLKTDMLRNTRPVYRHGMRLPLLSWLNHLIKPWPNNFTQIGQMMLCRRACHEKTTNPDKTRK